MATLSKKRGELFTTCITTFPTMVVFIPDMKKEVVEMMLSLYSNKWEEVEVDHSLRQAAELLWLNFPRPRSLRPHMYVSFFTGQELLLERRVCWR